MAEGTYGSPYYQQIVSPTEPSTSATKFSTNVTRKKTRKWVEAKKINYDGSGWGDDDDEDDDEYEDEAAPAAAAATAGPAHSAPLALPSQKSSLPSAALSRNPSPNPSLHLQTEQQPSTSSFPSQGLPSQSLPSQQPWRQGSPAPSSTRDSSPGISSPRSGALPTWRDGRAESPLGPRGQSPANSAGPNGPRAFKRPSEIYKRSIGQDEPPVSKVVDLPAAPAPAAAPAQKPAPAPVELPAAVVEPVITPKPQPTTQPRAQDVVETVIGAPTITAKTNSEVTGTATDANGERRFSSSPKLPDLARFSMFSPDLLFGGSNFLTSDAPPVPSMPGAAAQNSSSKETTPVGAPQPRLASVAEDLDRTSGTASPFSTSSIKSGSAIRDSAATAATASSLADGTENNSVGSGKPTLTRAAEAETGSAIGVKEPEEAKEESLQTVATASPDYSANQIAPLKPNRASQMFLPSVSLPVAPMGPRVMERTGTADTVSASVTSSPVKESDMLSEEIIRTLSPVKSAQSAQSAQSDMSAIANESDNKVTTTVHDTLPAANLSKPEDQHSVAEPTRTLTGDSSYLQDVYDDYWTPEDGSGNETYSPPPVPPLSTASAAATAIAPTEPVAVPAMTASPELTTASPYNLPSQTQQVPPLVNSPSPAASPGIAPAPAPAPALATAAPAVPTSISSVPGTRSSSLATAPNLRRRFSWEAEPARNPSPVMAQSEPQPQPQPPSDSARPASPELDPKASISSVSVVSATQESLTSPSPLSEAPASVTSSAATERPVAQTPTQGPIRSMLDVGDEKPEKPALRSMLDFDDVSAPAAAAPTTSAAPTAPSAPSAPTAPVLAVENVISPTAAATAVNRESVADSMRSAHSAQSVQSPPPVAPSSAPSSETAQQGGLGGANLAIYGSGNEGTAQFLTLRQCMAFGTHAERMAKLTETRREYSLAESGLSGWLTNMTVMPEYSRASCAPLWDGPLAVPPPTSRPAAAAVAAIAHVPHVNISSSQISNKSKEIFGVAGKAGKGLLALRKKGFHKKSAN